MAPNRAPGGWLHDSWALVRPWGAGGAYPNFPDPELADEDAAYLGPNRARLAAVQAAYDPTGLFAAT